MKVLIVSDTHGHTENAEAAIRKEQKVDYLIHCGDVQDSLEFFQNQEFPIAVVRGNCDWRRNLASQLIVELYNHRILIVHGHMEQVNYGLLNLYYKAKQEQCDIVCYGHTHVPLIEEIDDVTIVNPGSLEKPRQMGHKPTYAVLVLSEDQPPKVEIKTL